MYVQLFFQNSGIGSEGSSWSYAVALVCAVPMLVFGFIAWKVTAGKEAIETDGEQKPKVLQYGHLYTLSEIPYLQVHLCTLEFMF